jgi:Histidine kinase-, DNA gyrase B-, and HSP90-like ATPase
VKYTSEGSITVTCAKYEEPEGLRDLNQVVVEIVVSDTGCGIEKSKLESIFREFERVESTYTKPADDIGVGLGLAVVARIVEQLGGQLRVDSTVNEGSKFSFLIPLSHTQGLPAPDGGQSGSPSLSDSSGRISIAMRGSPHLSTGRSSQGSGKSEIDSFVDDLMRPEGALGLPDHGGAINVRPSRIDLGTSSAVFSRSPVNSPRMEGGTRSGFFPSPHVSPQAVMEHPPTPFEPPKLRTLIVEDNDVNRIILGKRLTLNGHTVVNTTNGQEGLTMIESDQAFDAVFMDIQCVFSFRQLFIDLV